MGVLLGRFVCGFLCPFGWLQDLLHKVPTKKFSTKKLKPLTYIKYAVLLLAVVLLPVLIVNDLGIVLKDKELRMDDIMFGLTEKIFGVDYYIVKTSIYRELKGLARQIGTYLELPQGMIYLN